MIKITLNNKKYKAICSWEEMALSRFVDLASIPIPEGYEALLIADGKFDIDDPKSMDYYSEVVLSLTDVQKSEEFPAYYRKVIACLSDAPIELLSRVSNDDVEQAYEYYFKPFVCSLLYNAPVMRYMGDIVPYEPFQYNGFRIGLSKFYAPETVNVTGIEFPLGKEPIITYSEAVDIFQGMRLIKEYVKNFSLFMAIYCRKKGERYNEQRTVKRRDLFLKVPMSIVWSVFFYTIQQLPDSSLIIPLFGRLPKRIQELQDQVRASKSMAVEV